MSLSLGVGQCGDDAHQQQTGGYSGPAQILSGSATAANNGSPQTIITIPAGRTWNGSLAISMTNQATTGTSVSANINAAGAGVVPASTVHLLSVIAGTVGAVAGDATNSNSTGDVTVSAPAANAVTLTLTNTTATTCMSMANANGVLI